MVVLGWCLYVACFTLGTYKDQFGHYLCFFFLCFNDILMLQNVRALFTRSSPHQTHIPFAVVVQRGGPSQSVHLCLPANFVRICPIFYTRDGSGFMNDLVIPVLVVFIVNKVVNGCVCFTIQ